MTFYYLVMYFFIYAVLGWGLEVAYAAVKTGKFINRGFLNGPICPIYGVGVVSVILTLTNVRDNVIVLYIASVVLVTVIEGLTGFVMDKIFHNKWWDYSKRPFNIGGYVCLLFSLVWGMFCVFIVRVFHPLIEKMILHIPLIIGIIFLIVCGIAMFADLYVTASAILKLNKRMEAMEKIAAELRELSDLMAANIYDNVMEGMENVKDGMESVKDGVETVRDGMESMRDTLEATKEEKSKEWYEAAQARMEAAQSKMEAAQARMEELRERYDRLLEDKGKISRRLLKAFPNMVSRNYKDTLQTLRRNMDVRRRKEQ